MDSTVSNSVPSNIQNLDSNNNKLIISNKSLEDSLAIASEEPQGSPIDARELSQGISNILKGIN